AELYGHQGVEADIEIIQLALASAHAAGLIQARIDLGHAGIVRALLDADPAAAAQSDVVCELLRAKDGPGLEPLLAGFSSQTRDALKTLLGLYGDVSVLARARAELPQ